MTRYVRGPLEAKVLAVFETHISATTTRIADQVDATHSVAGRTLRSLRDRGQVSSVRRGREAHYFLTPAQRSALL